MSDDSWSEEELRAAVDAYLDMQRKERQGKDFTKKSYYDDLAAKFGRTEKAFEYRMQNISYVMTLLGRDWLTGLKPAKNVGANVAAKIEAMIAQSEGRKFVPIAAFEIEAREAVRRKNLSTPQGNRRPAATEYATTRHQRDVAVKAWVLQQAKGRCEACGQPAPFIGSDDQPFLEVHHVRQLADNGSDTVTNAVALCPNCHREAHYGIKSKEFISHLYDRVARLVRE
jgi:5-methylcytosine-specific restriction protein A